MSNLRQAAQQALEALQHWDTKEYYEQESIIRWEAMHALRTALAEAKARRTEFSEETKKNMAFVDAYFDKFGGMAEPEQEPVAWDVFELRLYGAPQEKQHRVLWVDRYTHSDGSTPDLDGLLEAAKTEGGIDGGAKTLHVRPLYTAPFQQQSDPLIEEQRLDIVATALRGHASTRDAIQWAIEAVERHHGIKG